MNHLLLVLCLLGQIAFADLVNRRGGAGVNCASGTNGQVYTTNGTTCSFTTVAGTGSVTSIGVKTDGTTDSIFANSSHFISTSSVNPVTAAGNLTLTLSSQAANVVLAGPTSSTAAPTFRALVAGDIPSLPATQITSGTLPVARGGTNSATALNSNRFMVSSGGAVVEAAAVTASSIVVSDANGLPSASSVTTTVLSHMLLRDISGFIETPSNKIYTIMGAAPTSGTINSAWLELVSGTLTAAVKINGTNVTSLSAVSVTSTGAATSATGANTFTAGDKITLVVSSVSTPVDFDFSVKWTVN